MRFQPTEYPTIAVALVDGTPDGGCRVVVGAVGERPNLFAFATLDDVDPGAIAERVEVSEDARGHEDYKRHLTEVFVRRALSQLQEVPQ